MGSKVGRQNRQAEHIPDISEDAHVVLAPFILIKLGNLGNLCFIFLISESENIPTT
jgi:hypothetical protein